MASLFAGLSGGIKFPDVQMNKGPLPNTAGGPAGSDGTADGRYNFNSDLLSGIAPYAYGGPGRMGSDRNYQQIPHRIQKVVLPLYVPKGEGRSGDKKECITHGVDQGDIAFAINLPPDDAHHLLVHSGNKGHFDKAVASFTPFCNLVTANYLIAGMWRYGNKCSDQGNKEPSQWKLLADSFNCGCVSPYDLTDKEKDELVVKPENLKDEFKAEWSDDDIKSIFGKCWMNMLQLVRTCFLPFGICAGSEHQGGQHEMLLAPVSAAVNYVTVMTVDGQNRDLVNLWRARNLRAGDELIFRVGFQETREYVLNHYYKAQSVVSFDNSRIVPQLIPDVYSPRMPLPKPGKQATLKDHEELWQILQLFIEYRKYLKGTTTTQEQLFEDGNMQKIIQISYRSMGYWRIGKMMHHRGQHCKNELKYNDDNVFLTGGLLQVTFAPVWKQVRQHLTDATESDVSNADPNSSPQLLSPRKHSENKNPGKSPVYVAPIPVDQQAPGLDRQGFLARKALPEGGDLVPGAPAVPAAPRGGQGVAARLQGLWGGERAAESAAPAGSAPAGSAAPAAPATDAAAGERPPKAARGSAGAKAKAVQKLGAGASAAGASAPKPPGKTAAAVDPMDEA